MIRVFPLLLVLMATFPVFSGGLFENKYYECIQDSLNDIKKGDIEQSPFFDAEMKVFFQKLNAYNTYLKSHDISKENMNLSPEQIQGFNTYYNSAVTKASIQVGSFDPKPYDYILNHCHFKRRTNKMRIILKNFDSNIGNVKKYRPNNLKQKRLKFGLSRGLGSTLRSKYLLSRQDGIWKLEKALRFYWPISLNPLSKLKNKFDISNDMAVWLGIDQDPKFCADNHGMVDDHRDIKRGTFSTKKEDSTKAGEAINSLLVRTGGSNIDICRLNKNDKVTAQVKGYEEQGIVTKNIRAWYTLFWKYHIEKYYSIPGFFEFKITIMNREDKPARVHAKLRKKFKGANWNVGISRDPHKRAKYVMHTPTSRPMYSAFKPSTIVHEFGHSIGFIDEYKEGGKDSCHDRDYLMCSAKNTFKSTEIAPRSVLIYYWNLIRSYPFSRKSIGRKDKREEESDMRDINLKLCKNYLDAIPSEGLELTSSSRKLCKVSYNEMCITNSISNNKEACNLLKGYSSESFSQCPYCSKVETGLAIHENEIVENDESVALNNQPGETIVENRVENIEDDRPQENRELGTLENYEQDYSDIHHSNVNLFHVLSNRTMTVLNKP